MLVEVVEFAVVVSHVPRLLLSLGLDLFVSVSFVPMRAILIVILMVVPFQDLVVAIQIPLGTVLAVLLLDLAILQPKVIKPVEFLELNVCPLQVYLVQFHREQLIKYALKVITLNQQKIRTFGQVV